MMAAALQFTRLLLLASWMCVVTLLLLSSMSGGANRPGLGLGLGLGLVSVSAVAPGDHQCIHATRKLGKNGDGSTESSCMHCDPAIEFCYFNCQELIDQMYESCDDVCLPDGYYFDASFTLTGCWKDVKPDIKIGVERCGCNSATPGPGQVRRGSGQVLSTATAAAALLTGVLLLLV
jgi:hypothetical protein